MPVGHREGTQGTAVTSEVRDVCLRREGMGKSEHSTKQNAPHTSNCTVKTSAVSFANL
jgi:hypothetical protein